MAVMPTTLEEEKIGFLVGCGGQKKSCVHLLASLGKKSYIAEISLYIAIMFFQGDQYSAIRSCVPLMCATLLLSIADSI